MINYFNPNNTLKIINKIQKFVFALFIIVLLLGLVEALVLSPEDYKQSDSVRIMYVHVPSAWISLGIFSFISILSFGVFVFKNKNFSLITKSLAPSGFVFSIIALVTGSIWGKTNLGNLVGLGCKNNFNALTFNFLFIVHYFLEDYDRY